MPIGGAVSHSHTPRLLSPASPISADDPSLSPQYDWCSRALPTNTLMATAAAVCLLPIRLYMHIPNTPSLDIPVATPPPNTPYDRLFCMPPLGPVRCCLPLVSLLSHMARYSVFVNCGVSNHMMTHVCHTNPMTHSCSHILGLDTLSASYSTSYPASYASSACHRSALPHLS